MSRTAQRHAARGISRRTMPPPHSNVMHRAGWWCRCKRAVLLQTYYAALLTGIICLPFDFKRRRLLAPGQWRTYACIINILTVAATPAALPYALRAFRFYADNQLMRLINATNLCVRFAAVVLTVLCRRRRERHVREIVLQLLALEVDYFDAVPVQRCLQRRFDRLLYAKYCTVSIQLLASMYSLQRFGDELSLRWVLLLVYMVFTLYLLQSVTFHYFLQLSHICQRFCVLNTQLEEVFGIAQELQALPGSRRNIEAQNILRQLQHALANEVGQVARVHRRLTEAALQLNDCYQYQILLVLLTRFFNTIAFGYFGLRLFSSTMQHMQQQQEQEPVLSFSQFMFGTVRYVLIIVDLLLVDVVCDGTCAAHQRTAEILKRFHELTVLDADFERSCDLLALQLKEYKLTVNVCGLFKLCRHNSLVMFSGMIQHTVWLLQYDFEEHLR